MNPPNAVSLIVVAHPEALGAARAPPLHRRARHWRTPRHGYQSRRAERSHARVARPVTHHAKVRLSVRRLVEGVPSASTQSLPRGHVDQLPRPAVHGARHQGKPSRTSLGAAMRCLFVRPLFGHNAALTLVFPSHYQPPPLPLLTQSAASTSLISVLLVLERDEAPMGSFVINVRRSF